MEDHHITCQDGDVTKTLIRIQLVIGPKWKNKIYKLWSPHYVIVFNSLFLYVSISVEVRLGPLLLQPQTGLLHQPRLADERLKRRRNDNLEGRTEVFREEFVPVPLWPPQIPLGLPWHWASDQQTACVIF
jgi:hypothetical protein